MFFVNSLRACISAKLSVSDFQSLPLQSKHFHGLCVNDFFLFFMILHSHPDNDHLS